MKEIQVRKQTLLLESDLNRLALHAECAQLRRTGDGWLGSWQGARQRMAVWGVGLAAVAGLALSFRTWRRAKTGSGFPSRLFSLVSVLAPLAYQIYSSTGTKDRDIDQPK